MHPRNRRGVVAGGRAPGWSPVSAPMERQALPGSIVIGDLMLSLREALRRGNLVRWSEFVTEIVSSLRFSQ